MKSWTRAGLFHEREQVARASQKLLLLRIEIHELQAVPEVRSGANNGSGAERAVEVRQHDVNLKSLAYLQLCGR